MKLLAVDGAGYIGSHMVKMLVNLGHDVIILDNLSTGFRELAVGDLADEGLLEELFSKHQFDGVMHFAAASLVGESMTDPATLVADAAKAKSELNWQPKYDDLEVIVSHAWAWEKRLANID